jgi:predicted dehydrogenase
MSGVFNMHTKEKKYDSETPLRVAYVGCGGIAEKYLDIYRKLDFVQVAACIDIDLDAAESAARFLTRVDGIWQPLVTQNYEAALTDDIDVVVINTPNHLHREQAVAAFEAGKNVFLQKPVAPTVAESEAIQAAYEGSNTMSGLYMSYFDQPLFHDLKEMVGSGWFGEIGHFYGRLMHRGGRIWSEQALLGHRTWRDSAEQTGGGCFVQLAVHYIHLMEWMLNDRIVKTTAITKNQHSPGLEGEDISSAILEFSSGTMSTLDMGWNCYGEQFSIHGTLGSAEYLNNRILILESQSGAFKGSAVDFANMARENSSPFLPAEETKTIVPPAMGDVSNPFNQHRLFLEAVRDGGEPFVSIASGVRDMRVVAAVYESARRGGTAEVECIPSSLANMVVNFQ